MNFDLNAEETEAILAIRNMKDSEDIHISRKKDGELELTISSHRGYNTSR